MDQEKINQILKDPLEQDLLHTNRLARLAFVGGYGYPRVNPDWFYWNGAQILICTATFASKVRALKRNPKIALTVHPDTQPPHVMLVSGTGRIDIVDGIPFEYLEASKKGIPDQK
jgi:nitroimidazol reductase NimA-like FMN-containing flavoprotein (pyridoxamine 5'-phosphate oxidase superfamily)